MTRITSLPHTSFRTPRLENDGLSGSKIIIRAGYDTVFGGGGCKALGRLGSRSVVR